MRFPTKAYAEMVAAEEKLANSQQDAKMSAADKQVESESAIDSDVKDNNDNLDDVDDPENENLVD